MRSVASSVFPNPHYLGGIKHLLRALEQTCRHAVDRPVAAAGMTAKTVLAELERAGILVRLTDQGLAFAPRLAWVDRSAVGHGQRRGGR